MEGWLGEAALPHVERFFAGEEAVAEDGPGTLHDQIAMVVGRVTDEHLVDEFRVVELQDGAAKGAEVDEVAVALGVGEEEGGGVLAEDFAAQQTTEQTWAR